MCGSVAFLHGNTKASTKIWTRLIASFCIARNLKNLVERTLTNLYNERPAWLDNAHRKLDAAVFAAYGWDAAMSDDEILEKLLALNLAS